MFFIIGYRFFPEVMKQDAIQFPLALLLSIFLPVSFWQLANQKKGRFLALLFIGIFLVNISFLLVSIRGSFVVRQQISAALNTGIQPELAEYMVISTDSDKRKLAARLIYQQYGVALPFKNDSNSYTLYEPSESDKKTFRNNFFSRNELKIRKGVFSASLFTALLLLIIHAGLFVGLLVFLILYDRKRAEEGENTRRSKDQN